MSISLNDAAKFWTKMIFNRRLRHRTETVYIKILKCVKVSELRLKMICTIGKDLSQFRLQIICHYVKIQNDSIMLHVSYNKDPFL